MNLLNRLKDDQLAFLVATDCHDKDHNIYWCPTCDIRTAGIDEYRETLLQAESDQQEA